MAKFASGGIMKRGTPNTFKVSAAETASTTHPSLDTGEGNSLYVVVDVTAFSGTTPTLVLFVEGSEDGTTWFTLGTVGTNGYTAGSAATNATNITGVVNVKAYFAAPQFVRTRSVVGGTTPSFTYSVNATSN